MAHLTLSTGCAAGRMDATDMGLCYGAIDVSRPVSSSAPGLFRTHFYNHARRLRLKKLLYLELSIIKVQADISNGRHALYNSRIRSGT
jgi:hypothetical protein